MINVYRIIINALDKILWKPFPTASGELLDKWGYWVGLERKAGESDEQFRGRFLDKSIVMPND